MDSLDKWAAEKCGVRVEINESGCWRMLMDDGGKEYSQEWALSDARCREIVREHFKISTDYLDDGDTGWCSISDELLATSNSYGKSIEEAELKCLEVIYESEKI